jgi:hypothetical protein
MMPVMDLKQKANKKMSSSEMISWREHRIERIIARHAVYASFDFSVCSNEKIAEMFQVLVLEDEQGEASGNAQ